MREGRKRGRSGERRRRKEGKEKKKNQKRRPAEARRSRVGGRSDGGGRGLCLPYGSRNSLGKGLGLPFQTHLVSLRVGFMPMPPLSDWLPQGSGWAFPIRLLAPQTGTGAPQG